MLARLDRPVLVRAAALLLGGTAMGLGANAIRPGGVALLGFEAPVACSAEHEGAAGDVPLPPPVVELAAREASFMCGQTGVVFADTRPTARYEEGHAADALHLPCDATEASAEAAMHKLASARVVIVYGDSSDDGRAVAETLRRRGLHVDLRVLRGGFGAWEKEGLACASGPSPEKPIAESRDRSP